MNIEYMIQVTAGDSIDIDDIGNCCIKAYNDSGEEYYLYTKTYLGWVDIIQYGPATPDFEQLPKIVSYSYQRIEYDTRKLERIISTFLNNKYSGITQASLCDVNEIKENIKNFIMEITKDD